jgi:hypothetical protein
MLESDGQTAKEVISGQQAVGSKKQVVPHLCALSWERRRRAGMNKE